MDNNNLKFDQPKDRIYKLIKKEFVSYKFIILSTLLTILFIMILLNAFINFNIFNILSVIVNFMIVYSLWKIYYNINNKKSHNGSLFISLSYFIFLISLYLIIIIIILSFIFYSNSSSLSKDKSGIYLIYFILGITLVTLISISKLINRIPDYKDNYSVTFFKLTSFCSGICGLIYLGLFFLLLLQYDIDFSLFSKISSIEIYNMIFILLMALIFLYSAFFISSITLKLDKKLNILLEKYK